MLDYIIQVLLFQTLFLIVYDLLLKKETFFQWNRAYLLITSMVAYCIPFIKFTGFKKIMPQEYMILLPEVMLSPTTVIQETFDWSDWFFNVLQVVFVLGLVISFVLFVLKLYQLIQLIVKSEKRSLKKYRLVFLENSKAFSFFNYIFVGKTLSDAQKEQVITHELVHVRQKHSLDLFLFELQKIVCWFNPLSYVFQQRISELHEFIADSKTVKATNKKDYFQNLLSQAFDTHNISFINSFLKISLIKKRILMLNKNKSKQLLKFKYVLLVPVLLSMLLYSSCENDQSNGVTEAQIENRNTIISLMEKRINNDNASKEDLDYVKSLHYSSFDPVIFGGDVEQNNMVLDMLLQSRKIGEGVTGLYPNKNGDFSIDQLELNDIIRSNDLNNIKPDDIPILLRIINQSLKEGELDRQVKIKEVIDAYLLGKKVGEKKLHIQSGDNDDGIPFAMISKPPVFPGCEDAKDPRKCLSLSLSRFVAQNFDVSISKKVGLKPGKKKIYVQFKINTNGDIVDVKARAPHKALEKEATRTILSVPKLQAGEKENGEKVTVKYMLPITFNIH